MPVVRMVRHGEASAGYSQHPDPGLSELGRTQAETVAGELAELGPLIVVSSPMARARETADPLAGRWDVPVIIEAAVSEIPSPGLTPHQRGTWLQGVMAGPWANTTAEVRQWRDGVAATVMAAEADTVIFSHYVAINAAISVATDSPTPRCRHLDHCSVTTFDVSGDRLTLIEAGHESASTIL